MKLVFEKVDERKLWDLFSANAHLYLPKSDHFHYIKGGNLYDHFLYKENLYSPKSDHFYYIKGSNLFDRFLYKENSQSLSIQVFVSTQRKTDQQQRILLKTSCHPPFPLLSLKPLLVMNNSVRSWTAAARHNSSAHVVRAAIWESMLLFVTERGLRK